ncbi:MAG: alanine:cation symporter family protein [Dorea sp.]
MKGFRLVSALAIFLGAGMEMSLLWDLSDVLMGVMALINIPVILILSGIAVKAIQDYEVQLKQGINPVFKSADIGLSQKTDFNGANFNKIKRHHEKIYVNISIVR